ncbi:MAG: cyclodeaminase/cyclohydrolase family protein [Phascolarctobacterium faecium]
MYQRWRVATLIGIGAALTSMVANLTVKEKFLSVEGEMIRLAAANICEKNCFSWYKRMPAFLLLKCYKMPKATDLEELRQIKFRKLLKWQQRYRKSVKNSSVLLLAA